jgi:hypothetical protein
MSRLEWLCGFVVLFVALLGIWLDDLFDPLIVWWGRLWCHHVYRVTFDGSGTFLYLKCGACGKRTK